MSVLTVLSRKEGFHTVTSENSSSIKTAGYDFLKSANATDLLLWDGTCSKYQRGKGLCQLDIDQDSNYFRQV